MPLILNLPYEVIRFIVEKRSDKRVKNTYQKIADMVKAEFDIEMTLQNVEYHYKRNKDILIQDNDIPLPAPLRENSVDNLKDSQVVNLPAIEEVKKEALNNVSSIPNKPVLNFRKNRQGNANMKTGFDRTAGDNLSNDDIARLLGKSLDD